jgi:hypothetical protein
MDVAVVVLRRPRLTSFDAIDDALGAEFIGVLRRA